MAWSFLTNARLVTDSFLPVDLQKIWITFPLKQTRKWKTHLDKEKQEGLNKKLRSQWESYHPSKSWLTISRTLTITIELRLLRWPKSKSKNKPLKVKKWAKLACLINKQIKRRISKPLFKNNMLSWQIEARKRSHSCQYQLMEPHLLERYT